MMPAVAVDDEFIVMLAMYGNVFFGDHSSVCC
jgi:hypothetical protein